MFGDVFCISDWISSF